jgi:hypothetical protein
MEIVCISPKSLCFKSLRERPSFFFLKQQQNIVFVHKCRRCSNRFLLVPQAALCCSSLMQLALLAAVPSMA